MKIVFLKNRKMFYITLFLGFVIGGMLLWKEETILTNSYVQYYTIIVDAGHGKPDGGAISKNGIEEEALNLSIAKKLRCELESIGYEVIMTRETEENIADSDKKTTLKEIKTSDLENRVKIANESQADFMISIHMNQFPKSNYWGWQTFYSKDSLQGKKLANLIQKSIGNYIQRENKRTPLPIEGIKIVDKTNLPVVIVECGFLSNEEDLHLLQTEEYQQKIVSGIAQGIEKYYED